MPISTQTTLVYVKAQSGAGAPEYFTQADPALRVLGYTIAPAGDLLIRRTGSKSASGIAPTPVQGGRYWAVTLQTELYPWSDYTDVDSSPLSALMRACAQLQGVTYDSAAAIRLRIGAAYTLGTTQRPVTIEIHEIGGNKYRATDVVGIISGITLTAASQILIDWTLEGLWTAPEPSTFTLAAADYGTPQIPMVWVRGSATTGIRRENGSTEQALGSLRQATITPALQLAARKNVLAGSVEGYSTSFITRTGDHDTIAFSCDAAPEGDGADDISVWANWAAQATGRGFLLSASGGVGSVRMDALLAEVHYDTPVRSEAMPYREYDLVALGADTETGATYAGLELYFLEVV